MLFLFLYIFVFLATLSWLLLPKIENKIINVLFFPLILEQSHEQ